MRYKLLGSSGLRVSELCLGTMTFGTEWTWGAEKEECYKIFETFVTAGGNFIDTANRYTEGTSEKIVGELVRQDRDKFVVATKFTLTTRMGEINAAGNHRKNIRRSVEDSLRRLNTEYIDLYWLHAWDFTTSLDEILRTLDDLVSAGKILYIGISDTPAWIVARANTIAELRGWAPFVALQIEYSLIQRSVERELLPMARALDLAITPWAPLAGGLLSGKYNRGAVPDGVENRIKEGSARLSDRNRAIAAEVIKVGEELGVSPAQIALSWLRAQAGVIVPIVGARRAEQLAETLGSVRVELPPEAFARLNEVSKIDMGFPHDFLASDPVREIVFSGRFLDLDNHHVY